MPATLVTDGSVAGWFGKMPSLGDFASRRLPGAWIHAWDGWLQHELVRSRAALGDNWLTLYLVAPVRRFWLAPGLLAPAAWLGVLMPSVDSVGRHFPFTLATALPAGRDDVLDALANDNWLDAADAVARQVLDPAFDVAALEHAVADMPALHGERRAESHAGTRLAQQLRDVSPGLRCAWWCEGARAAGDFIVAPALPDGAAFDALLHGPAEAD
ncbi:MAG TPA: type VI secretion system-associated protein TagF [Burkholderiaceae bacterium]|nr:type VI secretion system-associated protein TagF [Burkholderiaceae bacterium]